MYYTLEPLTTDDSEPGDPDTLTFAPSVKRMRKQYQALVTIVNSDGKAIVLAKAHDTNLKTHDEAMRFANYLAQVVSKEVLAGYESYLETGEEP